MNRLRLLTLLFIVIVSVVADDLQTGGSFVDLQKAYTKQRIKLLSLSSYFKEKIVENLQIDIEDDDSVSQVIDFLKKIKGSIQEEFMYLLQEYNIFRGEVNDDIKKSEITIAHTSSRISELNVNIKNLQGEIDLQNEMIKTIVTQVLHLGQREKMINRARDIDIRTYTPRKFRDESALITLQEAIEKLDALYSSSVTLLERPLSKISENLKNIPLNDPIRAFGQISYKFSKEKLNQIIKLLEKIRDSIHASYEEDRKQEEISAGRYKDLLEELRRRKSSLLDELSLLNYQLQLMEIEMKKLYQEKDSLMKIQIIEEEILIQHKAYLLKLIALYEGRIKEAEEAAEGVKQALRILVEHEFALRKRQIAANAGESLLYPENNKEEDEEEGDEPHKEQETLDLNFTPQIDDRVNHGIEEGAPIVEGEIIDYIPPPQEPQISENNQDQNTILDTDSIPEADTSAGYGIEEGPTQEQEEIVDQTSENNPQPQDSNESDSNKTEDSMDQTEQQENSPTVEQGTLDEEQIQENSNQGKYQGPTEEKEDEEQKNDQQEEENEDDNGPTGEIPPDDQQKSVTIEFDNEEDQVIGFVQQNDKSTPKEVQNIIEQAESKQNLRRTAESSPSTENINQQETKQQQLLMSSYNINERDSKQPTEQTNSNKNIQKDETTEKSLKEAELLMNSSNSIKQAQLLMNHLKVNEQEENLKRYSQEQAEQAIQKETIEKSQSDTQQPVLLMNSSIITEKKETYQGEQLDQEIKKVANKNNIFNGIKEAETLLNSENRIKQAELLMNHLKVTKQEENLKRFKEEQEEQESQLTKLNEETKKENSQQQSQLIMNSSQVTIQKQKFVGENIDEEINLVANKNLAFQETKAAESLMNTSNKIKQAELLVNHLKVSEQEKNLQRYRQEKEEEEKSKLSQKNDDKQIENIQEQPSLIMSSYNISEIQELKEGENLDEEINKVANKNKTLEDIKNAESLMNQSNKIKQAELLMNHLKVTEQEENLKRYRNQQEEEESQLLEKNGETQKEDKQEQPQLIMNSHTVSQTPIEYEGENLDEEISQVANKNKSSEDIKIAESLVDSSNKTKQAQLLMNHLKITEQEENLKHYHEEQEEEKKLQEIYEDSEEEEDPQLVMNSYSTKKVDSQDDEQKLDEEINKVSIKNNALEDIKNAESLLNSSNKIKQAELLMNHLKVTEQEENLKRFRQEKQEEESQIQENLDENESKEEPQLIMNSFNIKKNEKQYEGEQLDDEINQVTQKNLVQKDIKIAESLMKSSNQAQKAELLMNHLKVTKQDEILKRYKQENEEYQEQNQQPELAMNQQDTSQSQKGYQGEKVDDEINQVSNKNKAFSSIQKAESLVDSEQKIQQAQLLISHLKISEIEDILKRYSIEQLGKQEIQGNQSKEEINQEDLVQQDFNKAKSLMKQSQEIKQAQLLMNHLRVNKQEENLRPIKNDNADETNTSQESTEKIQTNVQPSELVMNNSQIQVNETQLENQEVEIIENKKPKVIEDNSEKEAKIVEEYISGSKNLLQAQFLKRHISKKLQEDNNRHQQKVQNQKKK